MVSFISLVSGSSGNASFLSDGKTNILIDCGLSGKQLAAALECAGFRADELDAVLVTHEHTDHIKGAGVIARRYKLPVYATAPTIEAMDIGRVERLVPVVPGIAFEIGTIGVRPFSIPHDATDPVGYRFEAGGEYLAIATDIGRMNGDIMENLRGCRRLILESNHDCRMLECGPYPYSLKKRIRGELGHLSNDEAAAAAVELIRSGTEHILLGHLSRENNMPQLAKITAESAAELAGIRPGYDAVINVASRHSITAVSS